MFTRILFFKNALGHEIQLREQYWQTIALLELTALCQVSCAQYIAWLNPIASLGGISQTGNKSSERWSAWAKVI